MTKSIPCIDIQWKVFNAIIQHNWIYYYIMKEMQGHRTQNTENYDTDITSLI